MDRTEEFLACYSSAIDGQGEGQGEGERQSLRRRHKKERFAVEDSGVSLINGDEGADDDGGAASSRTFFCEASSVVSFCLIQSAPKIQLANVNQAEGLLQKTGTPSGLAELQTILDLCLARAVALQNLAENMAKGREWQGQGTAQVG